MRRKKEATTEEIETSVQVEHHEVKIEYHEVRQQVRNRDVACEICHHGKTNIYCTQGKTRYVKCLDCGHTFKIILGIK